MKTFNISGKEFQIGFGEVLQVEYKDSDAEQIQQITVKPLNRTYGEDETSVSIVTARPINAYVRTIPIAGEIVLLIKAPSPAVSALNTGTVIYYLDIVNAQSLINHNSVPTSSKVKSASAGGNYSAASAGGSNSGAPAAVDKNFPENEKAAFIQPYVGDVIVEGRYGQSIRFSSSQKNKGLFSKPTMWNAGSPGDPITVIRNSKFLGSANKYYAEDLEKDDSLIILTSDQKLPLKPAANAKKAANAVGIMAKYEKNQILLNSGRLILNARQEDILAYAKKGVHIAAEKIAIDAQNKFTVDSPVIHLGAMAIEPLILGQTWATWMNSLITALSTCFVLTAVGPSAPLVASPTWSSVASLQAQIPTLLSKISKTK